MQFDVTLSADVKRSTRIVFAILGVASVIGFSEIVWIKLPLSALLLSALFTPVVAALVFVICYRMQITGYSLENGTLTIHRKGKPVSIPLAGLKNFEPVENPFKRSIRIWGNGGIFGYYGKYRRVGTDKRTFKAYVTDTQNCVMLETAQGWVAISPRDRDAFLHALDALQKGQRVA